MLECALDPADTVSIPIDYNNAKLRCAKYEILGVNTDLTERRTKYVPDYSFEDSYDNENENDDEDSYDEGWWGI